MRSRYILCCFVVLLVAGVSSVRPEEPKVELINLDASLAPETPPVASVHLGSATNREHQLGINTRYLTLDGKPWLPVMGEFHYTRFPEQYWEEELLKMKSGGIDVVSTYVFWNHHEEIEGRFDWAERRDLRRFVQLCRKHGLLVVMRIGPYDHGEVRHGGLPDWIVNMGVPTRQNDPAYLRYVRRFYAQIFQQVHGLLWKDGGPIFAIQLENEYSKSGPGAGAAHITELKRMAREVGLDVPLYTVTGWDNAQYPKDEVVSVFGDYPDAFWDSSLKPLAASSAYEFERRKEADGVPYLMAEAGGGMQVAYHRRPVISADDVAAIAITHLGAGANLYGYYMYQGGANPDGKRTSLQESAETDGVYDLPVVSYDFQAPLGEYGQERDSYFALRQLHTFVHEFGSDLATFAPAYPAVEPKAPDDLKPLRAAFRGDGNRGFLFVNNYVHDYRMPTHPAVQFAVRLAKETVEIPHAAAKIDSGVYFVWPVNLPLAGATLKYATAQPLCRIEDRGEIYYFFVESKGVSPEFAFDRQTVRSVKARSGEAEVNGVLSRVSNIVPGNGVAIDVVDAKGVAIHIVVLSQDEGPHAQKIKVRKHEYLLCTEAESFLEGGTLVLRTLDAKQQRVASFPAIAGQSNTSLRKSQDGIFSSYAASVEPVSVNVEATPLKKQSDEIPTHRGKYNALAPTDADFEKAPSWTLRVDPPNVSGISDVFLKVHYVGDVARLYRHSELVDDDFYKGAGWEIGLKRFKMAPHDFTLKIAPLRRDAQVYIPDDAWPSFAHSNSVADLLSVEVFPQYELKLELDPGGAH